MTDSSCVEPRLDRVAGRGAVVALEALAREILQVALQRVAIGDDVARQVEAAEVEHEVAALGHRQGVPAGLGHLGEDPGHLVGRLHVELFGGELPAVGVAHRRTRLDAEQRLVGARVAGLEIVRVVGPGDRGADGAGDRERLARHLHLLGQAVGLDLHEVVVLAEDLLVPAGRLLRARHVTGTDQARHLGVEAARQHREPIGVLGEQLLVDPGLVVEALEVRLGDELDQVLVTVEVADQDREVVGSFVAAVLGAALGPSSRRHVELAADDRLDAGLLGGQVEVDRAEEIAVIGQGDGREVQVLGLLHQLLELGGPVEQAVLGVHVQVDELGAALHRGRAYSSSIVAGGLLVTS